MTSLAFLMLLPLVGAALIVIFGARHAKWLALLFSSVTFLVNIVVAWTFGQWTSGEFGHESSLGWFSAFGVTLNMGADSVSMLLILLTTLLIPLCVLGSFSGITMRIKEYYTWLLVIEAAMVGVFLARDLIFFYVCFEFTLVPMFFLIAIWGSTNRAKACTKFFLYTFTGSLITLAGLLYVAWQYAQMDDLALKAVLTSYVRDALPGQSAGEWAAFIEHNFAELKTSMPELGQWSFSIPHLIQACSHEVIGLSAIEQAWILFALMAGFAVKVPLFPVHTWLPLAHTEAPTAGSVILAGVLLKLGTYGLYRFVLPMVPDGLLDEFVLHIFAWDLTFRPIHFIAGLSVIGVLYAALVCWVQDDVKKLIAYSSVSHLGFCVLGLFALNPLGAQGSVLYMINHGLSTGALFFCIGMMYERYHTRDMRKIGGLAKRMPVWSFFMVFFTLASVGLPGLNGFVSEFLCLIGSFTATPDADVYPGVLGPWYAAIAGVGMIFAAMYLLIMLGKVVWGELKEPPVTHDHHGEYLPPDLTMREIGVLLPLAVLCLYLGFKPSVLTDSIEKPVERILAEYPQRVNDLDLMHDTEHRVTLSVQELAMPASLEVANQERTDG